MLNYKYILATGTAMLLPISVCADTCSTLPTCESIGFTVPSSNLASTCKNKSYLKCPFGNYYFCSTVTETPVIKTCAETVGAINGSYYTTYPSAAQLGNASSTSPLFIDYTGTFTLTDRITLKSGANINGGHNRNTQCAIPTLKLEHLDVYNASLDDINWDINNLYVRDTSGQSVEINYPFNGMPQDYRKDLTFTVKNLRFVYWAWLALYEGKFKISNMTFIEDTDNKTYPAFISVTDADVTIERIGSSNAVFCLDRDTMGETNRLQLGNTSYGKTFTWDDQGNITINGTTKTVINSCSSDLSYIDTSSGNVVFYGNCDEFISNDPTNLQESSSSSSPAYNLWDLIHHTSIPDSYKWYQCNS